MSQLIIIQIVKKKKGWERDIWKEELHRLDGEKNIRGEGYEII